MSAHDWQGIEEWLTSSANRRRPLLVLGPAPCGKSELLRTAAERIEGALLLDCAGLTADEVAQRIVTETGGDPSPSGRHWPRHVLHTEVRGDHILLLTNVQWAGALVTSSEPSRIGRDLLRKLLWAPRASLRVAVGADATVETAGVATTASGAGTGGGAAITGASTLGGSDRRGRALQDESSQSTLPCREWVHLPVIRYEFVHGSGGDVEDQPRTSPLRCARCQKP